MIRMATEDETTATPTGIPAQGPQVAGESAGGDDEYIPREGCVQIAYLHGNRVSHSWHLSMLGTIAYDKSVGLNLIGPAPFSVHASGPGGLVEGRNLAMRHFLEETDVDWLFMVDTDMGFHVDALQRLVLAAHPTRRPVLGGLCFSTKYVGGDEKGGFRIMPLPTLFMLARNEQGLGFANRLIYPPDALIQVAGTGAAFILIHRSVAQAMLDKYGPVWYNQVAYEDGTVISEDLSFCWRAVEMEIPIFVHTGIEASHHKEMWLGSNVYYMPDKEPAAAAFAAAKQSAVPDVR